MYVLISNVDPLIVYLHKEGFLKYINMNIKGLGRFCTQDY